MSGHGIFKTINGRGTVNIEPAKAEILGIRVYPNPCTGELNIQKPAQLSIAAYSIGNVSGSVLESIIGTATKINTSLYAKGNYWLQLHTQQGNVTIPFVVQ